ncbi:MAG: hypothetical protein JXQ66_02255 [Campylobacterales bacterium]|nr:hypothetical protein [Campylobacterales bacterium]
MGIFFSTFLGVHSKELFFIDAKYDSSYVMDRYNGYDVRAIQTETTILVERSYMCGDTEPCID